MGIEHLRHHRHVGCRWAVVTAVLAACTLVGCVRRTLTIQTEPPGALVFINDEEVGRSPVTTDFTWYGDYDLILRREDCQTLNTHVVVRPPWYQLPPIDFLAEVLWPGRIVDARSYDFVLAPAQPPDRADVIDRAQALRDRALFEAD